MSKVKILEVNKNLTNYTQEVLERVISTQNESQDQLQKAKKLETDLIARIREREERKALAKHEEEVRAQKEQEEAAKAEAYDKELEARIRSLTRRKFIQEDICLKCGRIIFDTRTRKASVDDATLSLTRKESALLEYFLLHQGRIISPEEMIEHLWDGSVNSFSNSIRVHISSLRKKLRAALGFDPIQNKIGQGYILMEEIS